MLVLNLLGTPEIKLAETAVSLNTAKARALLFYLAVTNQPHSRDALLDLLWSEMDAAKARRNLTTTLSSLRKQLDGYLLAEGDTLAFNSAALHQLDVANLTRLLASDDPAQWRAGIDLYRGEFLAGFTVANAVIFEEWVLTTGEQLRDQVVRALSRLVELAINQGDFAEGLNLAMRLLTLEPWLESGHRQLMILYARAGRAEAALAQYEKCRQILAAELGVTPAAATVALFERLQLARNRADSPLPDDGTRFVGRQAELAFLLERLRQPDCRLLTIVGLGGMGKSRLALAAARAVEQGEYTLFLNGIVFVSLVGVTSRDGLLAAILSALGTAPGRGPLLDQVINALRPQELLLVLDNFEQLLGEVALIQRIVAGCPDVTLLLTSREALGIGAEHRLDLHGLAAPVADATPEAIASAEAAALFLSVARQAQPHFELNAGTAAQLQTICQLVDGMPLALRLAAAWLRALPLAEIVVQLRAGLDILTTSQRDLPVRQRAVRAIFDQTLAQLVEDEVVALQTLSAFPAGFSAAAARTVAEATPRLLSELVDRGLIQLEETGRYQIHELLRQYAAEQRPAAAQDAFVSYMLTWLAERTPELRDGRQGEALRQIGREFGNILAAWELALAADSIPLLVAGAEPFSRFARYRGRFPEGIAALEPACARAAALNAPAEAGLRDCLGTLYFFSGAHDLAGQMFTTALTLAEAAGDIPTQAAAAFHLSQLGHFQHRIDDAVTLAERAHRHFAEANDPRGLASSMNMLGQLARRRGEIATARRWFAAAIELSRQHQDYTTLIVPLNNLGLLLHELGDFVGSLALFEECEAALKELGEIEDGLVMLNFGRNYEALGDIAAATAQYEGAFPVFERQHARHYILVARSYASRAARLRGDLDWALELINAALDGFRQANTRFSIAFAAANLGDIALARGELDNAADAYEESLTLMRELGRDDGQLRAATGLAQLALRRDELAIARNWLALAAPLARATHQAMYQHQLLAVFALFLVADGNLPQAVALFAWLQKQPTAAWETRQLAAQQAALLSVVPDNEFAESGAAVSDLLMLVAQNIESWR
ncbi:MAG: tetratricopeptide repeat protein [Ardenticatenales bacterium]|nr:tetratricopeptide repeat protein [Ardenticatenales bacterium]